LGGVAEEQGKVAAKLAGQGIAYAARLAAPSIPNRLGALLERGATGLRCGGMGTDLLKPAS
jgi:hypothetical protein